MQRAERRARKAVRASRNCSRRTALSFQLWTIPLSLTLTMATAAAAGENDSAPSSEDDNFCILCHGEKDLWEGDRPHLYVSVKHLATDVHWKKGIRCQGCHGGDPSTTDFAEAHTEESGFRRMATPADIPGFCGHCHSDIEYMRRFNPSARTDQEAEYWTSGHGKQLSKAQEDYRKALETRKDPNQEPPPFNDPKVAHCVSCHGRHGILAVGDSESPVYPTHVANTCATCHSDEKHMAGREYQGRSIGHDQFELWQKSVHGKALLEKGDLSAPTCNDCHGNHGAVPPDVDSVANACGTCHGKVGKLFAQTQMKHKFEEVGLPGCATCHGNHETLSPTDEMLGMEQGGVCVKCHEEREFGATLAGAEAARAMRNGLEKLKKRIAETEAKVQEAERLGMEVRGPRFDLRQAADTLVNLRTLVHTFAKDPFMEALKEGTRVTDEVERRAQAKLEEYTNRRVWLAATLVPILIVIVLLLLYIRTLPVPEQRPESAHRAADRGSGEMGSTEP